MARDPILETVKASDLMPMIARSASSNGFAIEWEPAPNFDAGNAQFFDPDPKCLIQLRPLTKADLGAHGAGRKANALLWIRGESGRSDLAYYVRVPPHLRKNNRAGVMRGIRCVQSFDEELGAHALDAVARTKWPKPEAPAWKA